mgnify:CR=1 FL=1
MVEPLFRLGVKVKVSQIRVRLRPKLRVRVRGRGRGRGRGRANRELRHADEILELHEPCIARSRLSGPLGLQ